MPNNSREFLWECLVREVASNPKRGSFLNEYAKYHGIEEANRLADDVRAEIRRRENGQRNLF